MGDIKKERKTAERMTIISHYTKVTSYFLFRQSKRVEILQVIFLLLLFNNYKYLFFILPYPASTVIKK